MFFYTYVLQSSKDRKYYIGFTHDLRRRIEEHTLGQGLATSARRPLILIYYESCLNEQDAKQREKYLKTTAGRRFLAKRLRQFRLLGLAS